MTTLITGTEGFAGSHLAEYLVSEGQDVIGLVREKEDVGNLRHLLSRLRLEEADVRNSERISHLLREVKPARIYHLAALSSPQASLKDPQLTYDVNFGGTLNILSAWRNLEADCRMLFVSSADVYGPVTRDELPLREESPFRPATPYAGSKAAGELLCVQFFQSYGLPIVRVRPFNHTGPRQSESFVCSSFARQVAEIRYGLRTPTITVGNLKASRDFTDVRDIVRGYHLLLERGEPGEVYQLCSGREVSIEFVLHLLTETETNPVQVMVDSSEVRRQEATSMWGTPAKAEHAAAWRPEYPLRTTLLDLKLYWEQALRSQKR